MNTNKFVRPFNKSFFSIYPSKPLALSTTQTVTYVGAFNFQKMLKFQHSLGSCSDKFVLMKKKEWRQPFSQFAVCLSS